MTDAVRIGVYGASGSGKTTKARELVSSLRRLVVFDPLDEWARKGWARCTTVAGVRQALRRGWSKGFRVTFVPPAMGERRGLHDLSVLMRDAQAPFRREQGPRLTLLVDEMNTAFPVNNLPDELYGFPELCSRGRHYGISIIGVSQRIAEVHTRFRGNMTAAYFFRQGDARDVATVSAMIGPQHKDAVRRLSNYEYMFFRGGQVAKGKTRRP